MDAACSSETEQTYYPVHCNHPEDYNSVIWFLREMEENVVCRRFEIIL
jgi:hypothetical protein